MRHRRGILLSFVLFALVGAGVGAWWTIQPRPSWAKGTGHYYVTEFSYGFSPGRMSWHPGEHVWLTFVNEDQSSPPKLHMFMIGRRPHSKPSPFQGFYGRIIMDGFYDDFLQGVDVRLSHPEKVVVIRHPREPVSGPARGMPFVTTIGPSFGIVLMGGGSVTIDFTVPDKPGTWQYACFEQSGEHYINGMRGTVTVTS